MKPKLYNEYSPYLRAVCLCSLGLFLTSCGGGSSNNNSTTTPPIADYGDAPDGGATGYPAGFAQTGQFPSLYASGGAHILDISAASLGSGITEEIDANVINDDIDDGVTGFATILTAVPPPTTMTVSVTGTEDGSYFFNSLIDLNMDGKWGGGTGANGETEWVVQNVPVTVTAGVVTPVTSPPFAFTDGILVPTHAWIRIALTKELVPQDWDGSGQFSKGEIEDHVISMPMINGKEVPMLSVQCGGPYKFNGADSIKVSCDVTNYRGVAGTFTHEVIHQPGGGTVNVTDCVPAGVIPIAAAPDKVTITCDAAKGQTRDVWTFKATAIDPLFMLTASGFSIEHSETTSTLAEFINDDVAPETPNDLFITSLSADDTYFKGQLGGPQGCYANTQIMAEVTCVASECGSLSESTTFSPNSDGSFKADIPDSVPAGEYEFKVMDINSPDNANCSGGGVYNSDLNTFVPVNLIKPNATYINILTGEPVNHGTGSSTKIVMAELKTTGPMGCLPSEINFTTTSTDNGNNFEDIQLIGPGEALVLGIEFSLEILFTLFGNYSTLVDIPDVPVSTDCPFGAKHDPSMDQGTNPLTFGIF